uniref:Uncharacterized protein n=1 Tax=Fundulus heteroclitus TaxID=8078 RepID=A0A3Q2PJE6_FUNHE
DMSLYRYSLNGKAVGMAILNLAALTANVYVTQLYAEFRADVVIVGGDIYMRPPDLGCRLLMSYTRLRDSCVETAKFDGCENGMTLFLVAFEKGIWVDYILFKGSSKAAVYCDIMSTTKGSIPGHLLPYSDQEALTAELSLETHIPAQTGSDKTQDSPSEKLAELVDTLTEARTDVKMGLHCAERMCCTHWIDGLGSALPGAGHSSGSLLRSGSPAAFPSYILLPAGRPVLIYPVDRLSAVHLWHHGAEGQMGLAEGSLQEKLRGFPIGHALDPEE